MDDLSVILENNPDLRRLNPHLVTEPVKRRKYGNVPTVYKGREYASIKEARRAAELDILVKTGHVIMWFAQVPFELQAGIVYIADFVIIRSDWEVRIEDTKGGEATKTQAYRMKRKLFREKYGRAITEV